MKKVVIVLLFIIILPSLLIAENETKKIDVGLYVLTTGAIMPSNYYYLNIRNPSGSYDNPTSIGYGLGGIIGYQFKLPIALEVGYIYNNISGNIKGEFNYSDFPTKYSKSISVADNDIKFNILFQPFSNLSENNKVAPYIGLGLIINIVTKTQLSTIWESMPIEINNSYFSTDPFFGYTFKTGIKYNYKYLLIGLGIEANIKYLYNNHNAISYSYFQLANTKSTLSVNMDMGFIF